MQQPSGTAAPAGLLRQWRRKAQFRAGFVRSAILLLVHIAQTARRNGVEWAKMAAPHCMLHTGRLAGEKSRAAGAMRWVRAVAALTSGRTWSRCRSQH